MALSRVGFAGFALGLVGAQLLPEQPVDFDELQRLMEKEGLTEGQDFAVPTNLSSPTICDSSVKQHSGRDHRENWKLTATSTISTEMMLDIV